MNHMFTDRVKRVMQMARDESIRLGHNYIGTEHLLLGIIKEGKGKATTVLINLGLNLEAVKQSIDDYVASSGGQTITGEVPFTPRAKQILEMAANEAKEMKSKFVGTEHLLLALLKDRDGVAAQILAAYGVDHKTAKEEVVAVLGGRTTAKKIKAPSQRRDTVAQVKQQIDIVTPLPGPMSSALQALSEDYEPDTFAHGQVPFGFRRGSGVFVEDVDGNTFLDFTSGVLVANIGHGRSRVMDKIEQMARGREITNSYNFLNPYRPALARLLMETVPDYCTNLKVGKAFILTTGSETVEWAMGMAIRHQGKTGHPEKKKIVAFEGAFHGRTAGARHAGGIEGVSAGYGLDIPDIVHIPFPDLYRPAQHADGRPCTLQDYVAGIERIDAVSTAAVIFETYQGAAGSRMFPADYLQSLAVWCRRHDVLLIVDEVQASFGRTGKFYAFEHYEIEPDILCLGKGISGSVPLAAVVARRDIIASQGGMSSTWGGNILSSAVALETIRVLIEEKVVENAAKVGAFMERRFREMVDRHPILGDSRQMGLVGGLDIVADKASKTPNPKAAERIVMGCYQKGLLLIEPIGLGGNVIRVAPPLIITEEQAGVGIDIIEEALTQVEAE